MIVASQASLRTVSDRQLAAGHRSDDGAGVGRGAQFVQRDGDEQLRFRRTGQAETIDDLRAREGARDAVLVVHALWDQLTMQAAAAAGVNIEAPPRLWPAVVVEGDQDDDDNDAGDAAGGE
jgi:hypothetical protein